ncbi:MAG: S8 family peptidase [Lachnospiraceae bacterium]
MDQCKEKIIGEEYYDWIIDYELTNGDFEIQEKTIEFCSINIDEKIRLAYGKPEKNIPLNELSYDYRYIPSIYGLSALELNRNNLNFDPSPLISSNIVAVQNAPLNLTGKGVIYAILDTGIDYQNPVFKNQDHTTRILSIWDQTIQEGTPPSGFYYGSEYTRENINEALKSDNPRAIVPSIDVNGHGTAMASVSVGSKLENGTAYLGAAPDADILVVKLKECKQYLREYYLLPKDVPAYQSTDIIMAMQYLDSYAKSFERPIVFCVGLVTSLGGNSENTILSKYMERIASKRSRALVFAGGNEGNSAHHYEGDFERAIFENRPENIEEVEIRVGENEKGFVAQLWGNAPNIFTISIRTPGGELLPFIRTTMGKGVEYTFVFDKTRIVMDYSLVESVTGDQLIVMRFINPTPGIWTLLVKKEKSYGYARFQIWLPLTQFLSSNTYFLKPTPDMTLSLASFSNETLGTSTYDSKSQSFYPVSGRGFSRDLQIKPDICSPGVNVSVAKVSIRGMFQVGSASGSSIAASILAGAVAQFMQWAIVEKNAQYIRSVDIKNYFIRGAKREDDLVYPSKLWGFGKLDVKGIFELLSNRNL